MLYFNFEINVWFLLDLLTQLINESTIIQFMWKGQINLKDLDICLDNQTGEIKIKEKKHSTSASIEKLD